MAVAWSDNNSRTFLHLAAYLESLGYITKTQYNRIVTAATSGRIQVTIISNECQCWVDGVLKYTGTVPTDWVAALAAAV